MPIYTLVEDFATYFITSCCELAPKKHRLLTWAGSLTFTRLQDLNFPLHDVCIAIHNKYRLGVLALASVHLVAVFNCKS